MPTISPTWGSSRPATLAVPPSEQRTASRKSRSGVPSLIRSSAAVMSSYCRTTTMRVATMPVPLRGTSHRSRRVSAFLNYRRRHRKATFQTGSTRAEHGSVSRNLLSALRCSKPSDSGRMKGAKHRSATGIAGASSAPGDRFWATWRMPCSPSERIECGGASWPTTRC